MAEAMWTGRCVREEQPEHLGWDRYHRSSQHGPQVDLDFSTLFFTKIIKNPLEVLIPEPEQEKTNLIKGEVKEILKRIKMEY